MSRPSRKEADESKPDNDNLPARYEVGYGKPPLEHRFRKGKSGNPNGRPKGARNKAAIEFGFGNGVTEELLKQEAYRAVTVREGDQIIELPVIQAVFRAMGLAALKGNRFAQRSLAEMVQNVEAQDRQSKLEYLQTMYIYKQEWTKEIERCRAAGRRLPDMPIHPDDIIIHPSTGGVQVLGPKTKEEKERYDRAIEARDDIHQYVRDAARRYRKARSPDRKAEWLEVWHFGQDLFDKINEALGPRYQAELEHRSYAPGANRKGDYAKKYAEQR